MKTNTERKPEFNSAKKICLSEAKKFDINAKVYNSPSDKNLFYIDFPFDSVIKRDQIDQIQKDLTNIINICEIKVEVRKAFF